MRRNIIGRRIPNPISSSPFSTSSGRGGGGGRGGANPFSASDKLDSSARAPGKPEYEESKPVSPDPQSGIGRGSGGGVDFASFISALRTSKPGVGRGRGTDEPPRSRPTPPQPREVPNQPFRGQPYQQPQSVPNQGQFADSAEDNLRFRGPPHQQHQSVPDQRQFEQNVQFRGPPHQQHQSGPDQRQFEQQFRGPPHQQHQSGPNQRQFEQQFRGPPHQQPQSGQFEQNMQFRGPPHEQHQSGQGQFEQNMQFRGPPHQQHQSGQRQFEQNMQFRGPPHQQHQSGHRQFEQNMQPRMDLQPSGIGRGTSDVPPPLPQPTPRLTEENRHVRSHGRPQPGGKQQAEARVERPKLSREDAVKRAVSILSKGDGEGAGGRGGGYGRGRGGRGRGGFQGRERFEDGDSYGGLDMGDDADGERLAERLGVENMQKLVEEFQNLCDKVLPTPEQDAYVDALHTNYAIEFEPEYLMGEFDQNPDIDEKPPMPLRDMLEKVKPFIMAYEGIQSQEEWEEVVEETMKRVPALKEIVDYYSGPDRVTAKKQSEELERVAKLIPPNAPASVKQFTDRAVLSLQSNPGWGFDKKCQYMDKLVREVNQCYP